MIRLLWVWVALAGLAWWIRAAEQPAYEETLRQAEQIVAQETPKPNAAVAAGSTAPPVPEIPQLSANPASESEMQSRRMLPSAAVTNAAASPVKRTAPQIENMTFFVIGGMIAVLVIVAVTGRRPKE